MEKKFVIDRNGQLVIHDERLKCPSILTNGILVFSADDTADLAHLLDVRLQQELAAQIAVERLGKMGFFGRLLFLLLAWKVK